MNRLFKLQFLGPLALFLATLSAEVAARALEYAPKCELLWFINLRMFGIFQRSHALLSYIAGDEFQLYGIALPIFALGCVGLASRSRLPLALAAHLSVAFSAFLISSWQTPGLGATAQASIGSVAVPTGAGWYVLAIVVGASLLSFVLSHLAYLLALREEL